MTQFDYQQREGYQQDFDHNEPLWEPVTAGNIIGDSLYAFGSNAISFLLLNLVILSPVLIASFLIITFISIHHCQFLYNFLIDIGALFIEYLLKLLILF